MAKMIVAGAAGRMGREIMQAVIANETAALAGGFERPEHEAIGRDLGRLAGVGGLGLELAPGLAEVGAEQGVVIDFTAPEASVAAARQAAELGLAMVIGTTGLTPDQVAELKELGPRMPLVFAPNMSVGVNVLLKLVAEAARLLGPAYDIEIVEAHHKMKKDAPSGTALALARAAAEPRGLSLEEHGVFERNGLIGERSPDEIGVQTIRAADIVGEHTVYMAGTGERVELIHRCHSRATFAQGAVRAALWVAEKPNGFYDMQDVLGLK